MAKKKPQPETRGRKPLPADLAATIKVGLRISPRHRDEVRAAVRTLSIARGEALTVTEFYRDAGWERALAVNAEARKEAGGKEASDG